MFFVLCNCVCFFHVCMHALQITYINFPELHLNEYFVNIIIIRLLHVHSKSSGEA